MRIAQTILHGGLCYRVMLHLSFLKKRYKTRQVLEQRRRTHHHATLYTLDVYNSVTVSTFLPKPFQRVPAPTPWEISAGISLKIFAIHMGSVNGVRSSRLGNNWRNISAIALLRAASCTNRFDLIVRSLPATGFTDNERGRRLEGVVYPSIICPE